MRRRRAVRIGTSNWSIPRAAVEQIRVRWNASAAILAAVAMRRDRFVVLPPSHRKHVRKVAREYARGLSVRREVPRTITHERELRGTREPLVTFLAETEGLAEKRGPLLVQLPPSLAFHQRVVARFFDLMRELYSGAVVCEPRHATWFSRDVASLLERYRIPRVAADPAPVPAAAAPAGWSRLVYFRLHGSPRKYWSSYDGAYLTALAGALSSIASEADVWCIFDNTASGAAIRNALDVNERFTVGAGAGERPTHQSSESSAGHVR